MMRKFLASVTLTVVTLSVSAQTSEQVGPEAKRQEITKLLETTQVLALSQQMASSFVSQVTGGIRLQRPDIPQTALDFLPAVVGEVVRENEGFFKEMFISLYDRHFTVEDIRALNAFYETVAGKKMIQKQSILMQQGMTLGAEWGRSVGPEIDRRVREKLAAQGYKL